MTDPTLATRILRLKYCYDARETAAKLAEQSDPVELAMSAMRLSEHLLSALRDATGVELSERLDMVACETMSTIDLMGFDFASIDVRNTDAPTDDQED